MPWQKSFDVDATLDRAMHAFWARGYEATSLQDLLDCMGINRGSLYGTYGDKRALFLKALERYDRQHRRAWVAGIAADATPVDAIARIFEDAVAAAVEKGSRDGCLLVNTALELSPHDKEIQNFVSNALSEMEDFFEHMIERGKAGGTVPGHIDASATAGALLSLFIGLRVLARSRPEPQLLNAIAAQAQALLR